MPHTYISFVVHYVFSTKNRRRMISPDLEQRLWPYMGGIARANNMTAFCIGGTEDHVHMLVSLPSTISVAKAVQLVKGGSSKWVHEQFPEHREFEWQRGYGAFTIGISHLENTIKYIESQKEHHKKVSFQEEYLAILRKHGLEYDERYVWD